jgi:four helix bundle protein
MVRETVRTFQDLIVWQKSHAFVLGVYSFSRTFPKEEMFGLTAQFRRAAMSIAANIAEGFKKKSSKDKLRFYNIAQGSVEECRYYLILADDLGYAKNADVLSQLEETSKLLEAYAASIQKSEF